MTAAALKPREEAELGWTFFIDITAATEAVLRVLQAFALGGADLTDLEMKPLGDGMRLSVVAVGLDEARADHIRSRLAQMPVVSAVASGWRSI